MTAKKINTAAAGMYAHHVARERRWIAAFNTSLDVIDGSVQIKHLFALDPAITFENRRIQP